MNIIVMSISSKVPLLKAIKKEAISYSQDIKIYGADNNDKCIGQYFVDHFWHCPKLDQLHIEQFIDFCKANMISVVLPTRDGELLYFTRHKRQLATQGILVMISEESVVQMCLDKLLFSETLMAYQFPVIPSYLTCPEGYSAYVVKERFGSGSKAIGVNLTKEKAIQHATTLEDPIYQPYITGTEYSVDIYNSAKEVIGVIVRVRELVVHGESQVTTTVRMPFLEDKILKIVEKFSFRGHILFQVLVDNDNQIHIIECNCRIGGASTLSFAAGLQSVYWFLQESNGISSDQLIFERSTEEKRLIRYAEDMII